MFSTIAKGLLIPFLGTTLGSACVFFMKNKMSIRLQKSLSGFAAGVMVAASVWSLLIPSMSQAEELGMGKLAFIPAVVGFCLGMLFLLLLDILTPHMHINETVEGPKSKLKKSTMMVLAVTLHNIPEGMAVSVPIYYATGSKVKALRYSFLTGLAEPIGAAVGALILLPFWNPVIGALLLAFVAGIMVYISFDELLPGAEQYGHHHMSIIGVVAGMAIMAGGLLLF